MARAWRILPETKPVYRFSFSGTAPVKTVADGESFTVELRLTRDGLGPELQPLPDALFAGGSFWTERFRPTDPIAVENAQPGDALRKFPSAQVFRPNGSIARTWLAPNHGFLPDASCNKPLFLKRRPPSLVTCITGNLKANSPGWPTSRREARGHSRALALSWLHRHRLRFAAFHSAGAGLQGGEYSTSHPDLVADISRCVVVAGDAAREACSTSVTCMRPKGYGETAGGGLEISGTATVRVSICLALQINMPRYQTSQGSACLTVAVTVESAMKVALAGLIALGHGRRLAYLRRRNAGQLRLCSFWLRWHHRLNTLSSRAFLDHDIFRPSQP